MNGGILPANVKRASALRRVPSLETIRFRSASGGEGDVCAFELSSHAPPITVESATGRMMTIAPGDVFLGTPGHRAARRWAVGSIPDGGLVPGNNYWVLSESGVVGNLVSRSHLEMRHLGRVRYLGAVYGVQGETLNIRQFGVTTSGRPDRNAPLYLILGTSSEVGKTTAGVSILRMLRLQGYTNVVALKATGTSSFAELAQYIDFGAAEAFDCIDFGFPATYPVGRSDIVEFFLAALDFCLSLPAEAVVVECAGDPVSANGPQLLKCVKARRRDPKIILAAADALGALGAKRALADFGLEINLITGPCTDTAILRQWTEDLCGIPAINMAHAPASFEMKEDVDGPHINLTLDTPQLAATYEEVSGHQQFADGKELVSALRISGGERILDIGAGTGHLAAYVQKIVGSSGSIVAVDPLPLRVEIAQSKADGNFEARVGRAEDLSEFAEASFDVVYLNCVFHWIEDKKRALKEIYRVLKTGGRLGLNCQDTNHQHEAFHFIQRAMTEAGVEYDPYVPSLSSQELEVLVTGAGFVAYEGELRRFINLYRDVDHLLAWVSSSSFGNFLANVSRTNRARMRDALDRLLEPKRCADEGIRLERYLLFATTRKPTN
jgi:ubiquinone/menaquinone biosynthesis C-methylase UbiE